MVLLVYLQPQLDRLSKKADQVALKATKLGKEIIKYEWIHVVAFDGNAQKCRLGYGKMASFHGSAAKIRVYVAI